MRASRCTAVAAVVLVAAAASPSLAARRPGLAPSKPLVITDKTGDANGINSQSKLVEADPSQSTPSQYTAADIVSVAVGRLDNGKQVQGLKVTFTLSAAPGQGVIYRLQGSTPACGMFWVSYNAPLGAATSASLRHDCGTPGEDVTIPMTAVVKDKTVTINLPFTALPKNVKLGQAVTVDLAETKGHASTPAAGPTIPTIDDVDGKGATYKIGA